MRLIKQARGQCLFLFGGLNEAIARLKAEHGGHAEIELLLSFITSSKRGFTR